MSQRERQKESERAREGARETTRKNKGKPEIAFSFKVTYLLQICLFVANLGTLEYALRAKCLGLGLVGLWPIAA